MAEAPAKRSRFDVGGGPSEADILRLVSQRESFRQARRFSESDAIREELRAMGVELYDKEKEWRSRDGRRGTLFTAGSQECHLSDMEIQSFVAQREDARKAKDWARADQFRDELRQNGVELDDKENIWRTAGGRMGRYDQSKGGMMQGMPQQQQQPMQQMPQMQQQPMQFSDGAIGAMPSSNPVSNGGGGQLGVPAIRKLVADRERLRASMDFEAADELRRQLQGYGVEIFDNERIWRCNDGSQGVIISGGFEGDCMLSDADIMYQVSQREAARSAKDWGQADMVRDELRRNGVELIDQQKVWVTTDGRQGGYNGNQAAVTIGAPMHAPCGGGCGGQQGGMIMGQQMMPQQQQQFMHATPSTSSSPLNSAVTTNPSTMTFKTSSIVALIQGRERARENHDWAAADDIRSDLRAHGVDVWDKEKVWRSNDGRSGPITKI